MGTEGKEFEEVKMRRAPSPLPKATCQSISIPTGGDLGAWAPPRNPRCLGTQACQCCALGPWSSGGCPSCCSWCPGFRGCTPACSALGPPFSGPGSAVRWPGALRTPSTSTAWRPSQRLLCHLPPSLWVGGETPGMPTPMGPSAQGHLS